MSLGACHCHILFDSRAPCHTRLVLRDVARLSVKDLYGLTSSVSCVLVEESCLFALARQGASSTSALILHLLLRSWTTSPTSLEDRRTLPTIPNNDVNRSTVPVSSSLHSNPTPHRTLPELFRRVPTRGVGKRLLARWSTSATPTTVGNIPAAALVVTP